MNSEIIEDKLLEDKYGIKCNGYGDYDGCHIGGYRYKLEITVEPKLNPKCKKTLACIMMNPSTTFPNNEWKNKNWQENLGFKNTKPRKTVGFDPTVRNVIRMAHSKGYSKVCIFNLFPYIQPKGKDAKKNYIDRQNKNEKVINNWQDKNCKELLVAWGATLPTKNIDKEKYINLQKRYIEIFRKKKINPVYYEWNKESNCPYHPSLQVDSCWTKDEKNNIVKRKKGNKSEKGIIQLFIEGNSGFKEFDKSFFN